MLRIGEFSNLTGISIHILRNYDNWQKELTKEDYEAVLQNTIMFSGTVPKMPNRLLEIDYK